MVVLILWGPFVQGDQISWGPFVQRDRIRWGPFVQRDQIGWRPFVQGGRILGDHLSKGTGSGGDHLSSGTKCLGTGCGGPDVRGPYAFRTKCVAAKIPSRPVAKFWACPVVPLSRDKEEISVSLSRKVTLSRPVGNPTYNHPIYIYSVPSIKDVGNEEGQRGPLQVPLNPHF